MPPILAKVRCDAVRPGRCGCQGRLYRVGMIAPARVANSRHMVDIDTKTKGAGIGHRLTPFGYLASPAQWKPVPAAGCPDHKSGNSAKRVARTARKAPLLPLSVRPPPHPRTTYRPPPHPLPLPDGRKRQSLQNLPTTSI